MAEKPRPDRATLFGFYYLGFDPEGRYKFPNAHHVGAYYGVSADAIMRWLEELELDPRIVTSKKFNLPAAQVDLQLEAEFMPDDTRIDCIQRILRELDAAEGGREPWID